MRTQLQGAAAKAHLLRRTCFMPTPRQWAAAQDTAYEDLVTTLVAQLDHDAPAVPEGLDLFHPGTIQQLWLERMVASPDVFAERLTLFWHGHFATSNAKLQNPKLMWQQYELLRRQGGGSFGALLKAISRDPAMIRWLDGNSNRKGHANENYGRELQELFTLGIGNYTEEDVREAARAFTGWGSRGLTYVYREDLHDAGEKTLHGKTGPFNGDDVIDILLGLEAASQHLATHLLTHFVHPAPSKDDIDWLARVLRDTQFDMRASLAQLFVAPAFLDARNERALVRSPVEFVVAIWRALDLRAVPAWIHGSLDRMGQILFRPPSVKGWTQGSGWLTSGGVIERLAVAGRAGQLAPLRAGHGLAALALGDPLPPRLVAHLEGVSGADLVRRILACPAFQLA